MFERTAADLKAETETQARRDLDDFNAHRGGLVSALRAFTNAE